MSRIVWSVVVMAAVLAACGGKSDHSANTSSSATAPSGSGTSSSASGSTSTGTNTASTGTGSPAGSGSGTNTTGGPTASASTADTSASPAAAVGGPTSTPSAVANSGTSTAQNGTASNTGVMGAASGGNAKGQQVFSQTCVACHGTGVAGAPKVGDKAEWGPRIAEGQQTLYQHAINGYQGKKGMMPPKGGNTALPDADVRAAVDYMVAQAK